MIRLVRADVDVMNAALDGDGALARALGHAVVPSWATFRQALEPLRDVLAADPSRADWGTRLFVTEEPRELVGWGGFKGPPEDGVAELGYEIAPSRQGRGLATAAVHALLAEAFAHGRVTEVIAHTLAERNASNRVLEKAGFVFDADEWQDGVAVWRYSLPRDSRAGVVQQGIAAFNRRDFDAALALAPDDVTWEPLLSRAESPLLRGRDEIRAAWESQVEALDVRVEPRELIPAGEDHVIVSLRMVGHGRGSDMPVSTAATMMWTFGDDGRWARVRLFDGVEEALAAVGH
ncbi:MAG TPA: GNAT family N-acetyltransferase [Thermoleophilaceae bacterium]|nr:GNAT family N-acetyltransferase [Thermoleophilaceae bacterium]